MSSCRVFYLARTFVRADAKNPGFVPFVPTATDHDGEHRDRQQQNSGDDQEASLQGASRLPQCRALKHQKLARMNPRSVRSESKVPLAYRQSYLAMMPDNA